jgi:hypothetical protein
MKLCSHQKLPVSHHGVCKQNIPHHINFVHTIKSLFTPNSFTPNHFCSHHVNLFHTIKFLFTLWNYLLHTDQIVFTPCKSFSHHHNFIHTCKLYYSHLQMFSHTHFSSNVVTHPTTRVSSNGRTFTGYWSMITSNTRVAYLNFWFWFTHKCLRVHQCGEETSSATNGSQSWVHGNAQHSLATVLPYWTNAHACPSLFNVSHSWGHSEFIISSLASGQCRLSLSRTHTHTHTHTHTQTRTRINT